MTSLKLIRWSLFCLVLGLTFTACQNDDDPIVDPPADEAPAAPSPTVGEGDGAFWAINAITTITTPVTLDTEIGTAVAILTTDNFKSFVDAGEVKVMDAALTKNDNNSYVYLPGITQPLGLQIAGDYTWEVSGSASVPAFSQPINLRFPKLGLITSGATVEKANGYTLTCASVSQADSVIYSVAGVLKTVAGNVTSVEFTADDLTAAATGASYIQVAAYVVRATDVNGKIYYFGNETVRSQVIEVK